MPDTVKPDEMDDYNPLIMTDSGRYIWGIECFWTDDAEVMNMPLDILEDAAKLQTYLYERAASTRNN